MAKQTKSKRKRSEKASNLVDDPFLNFFQSFSVGTEALRKISKVSNRQARSLELQDKTEYLKSRIGKDLDLGLMHLAQLTEFPVQLVPNQQQFVRMEHQDFPVKPVKERRTIRYKTRTGKDAKM